MVGEEQRLSLLSPSQHCLAQGTAMTNTKNRRRRRRGATTTTTTSRTMIRGTSAAFVTPQKTKAFVSGLRTTSPVTESMLFDSSSRPDGPTIRGSTE
mmetsp:Transcript_21587/g.45563  ORF Transcript_21587/g.45563 Transcript_21587/m.45563 type:complete len:97 (+) Transcript_21587:1168-1458(+)